MRIVSKTRHTLRFAFFFYIHIFCYIGIWYNNFFLWINDFIVWHWEWSGSSVTKGRHCCLADLLCTSQSRDEFKFEIMQQLECCEIYQTDGQNCILISIWSILDFCFRFSTKCKNKYTAYGNMLGNLGSRVQSKH